MNIILVIEDDLYVRTSIVDNLEIKDYQLLKHLYIVHL